jgi:class 3 adenylate cyclase
LALTDEFQDVTLLYADIAGFTKYSSSVTPAQVVIMLRNLFTEFDKSCLKYKVYKVYTIGDCYVVMGFTNALKRNPVEEAKNVVKMGLSMIEIIRNVRNIINFHDLDMRIGIHTVKIFFIFKKNLKK